MSPDHTTITFPPFRLDVMAQRLWRDEGLIELRPKSFAVLQYLIERAGELVTKEQLLTHVWPDVFVSDEVLKGCVRDIRRALHDDATVPRFVETAHRRGYRFIAPVVRVDPLVRSIAPEATAGEAAPVGRDEELAQLDWWLSRALAGARQCVFVTGEPGIGKTTLVETFVTRARARHHVRVAHGQCLAHFGVGEAYMPVLDALTGLCRQPEAASLRDILRQHAPLWLAQMPALTRADEREALHREIRDASRERMLREMGEALNALTQEMPLVLVLEDLHWSDCSTIDLLSWLARRREPARLMVVGTYRPADVILERHPVKAVKEDLALRGACEELMLWRLSEPAVAEYLANRFADGPPSSEHARLVHARTEGNPLFMVSLSDYLESHGLANLDGIVPHDVRQMIERQLDALTPEEQRLLEAASVADEEFPVACVAAALDMDVASIEETCEQLAQRHQFLVFTGAALYADGTLSPRYRFLHALYRDVLYDRMGTTRRAQAHLRLGMRVEALLGDRAGESAAKLATHFERGRDYARALTHLRNAVSNAAHRFAFHDVLALSARGLALVARLPETAERGQHELGLLLHRAGALVLMKGVVDAELDAVYERAIALAARLGDTPRQAFALLGAWGVQANRGELRRARAMAEQLIDVAASIGAASEQVTARSQAHWAMASTRIRAGELTSGLTHARLMPAMSEYERAGVRTFPYQHHPAVMAPCFEAWALCLLGYPDHALRKVRDALDMPDAFQHAANKVVMHYFAALVHLLRREAGDTHAHAATLITVARQHGFALWAAVGEFQLGWALAALGQVADGIARVKAGVAAYDALGPRLQRPCTLGLLTEALRNAGDTEEALRTVTQALAECERTGDRYYEAELHRLHGELLLDSTPGRPPRAIVARADASIRTAATIARSQQAKAFELRAAISLYRLRRKWDRGDGHAVIDAHTRLTNTYRWFAEGFETADLREARALLAK